MSNAPRRSVTESATKDLIRNDFGTLSLIICPENRKEAEISIRHLAGEGLSIRQLSRLTGISKSLVEKALKYGREPSPVLLHQLAALLFSCGD